MAAIPPHDTPVTDEPWDGTAEEARLSDDDGADVYRDVYAWVDPDADADLKGSYKFPHHVVSDDGVPGAANLEGCRGGLQALGQADVPDADRDGIERHLQQHVDAEDAGEPEDDAEDGAEDGAAEAAPPSSSSEQPDDEAAEAEQRGPEARGGWLAEVTGRAWAIRPELFAGILELRRGSPSSSAVRAFLDDEEPDPAPGVQVHGQVAVIPLYGMITPRASLLSMLFGGGGGSLELLLRNLDAAVNNADVKAIVLDVDSPGGLVDGVPEAATAIREARGSKPIVAVANTIMASAAYWLGSQADEVVVAPSGEAGSIGVYAAHEDVSALMDRLGVKTTLVSAGKYKTEGNPFEPLGAEAREHLQAQVDDLYSMFVADVAKGRDVRPAAVRAGFGEGRLELARRAVESGLADRVATLDQTVRTVLSGGRRPARQRNGSVPAAEATAGAVRGAEGAEAQAGAGVPSDDERRRRSLLVDALG